MQPAVTAVYEKIKKEKWEMKEISEVSDEEKQAKICIQELRHFVYRGEVIMERAFRESTGVLLEAPAHSV